MHHRIVPDQAHWDRVTPKLETSWKVCILEISGRWYTKKIDLSNFAGKKELLIVSVEWMMTSQQLSVAITHARSPHSTCHA